MAKTYSLAIEVESAHIDHGLGYLISFELAGSKHPENHPDFADWSAQLKDAVIRANDQPFNPDPYTRKVAVAELMYDIEKLNSRYDFKIDAHGTAPAVTVQSSNPHDKRICINFGDEDGQLDVKAKKPLVGIPGRITENGKTTVITGTVNHFPFTPVRTCATPPPKAKPQHPQP